MKLKALLKGISYEVISGNADIECTGITSDSRKVEPGYCFVCIPGTSVDGHDFAPKAVENGASVLIVSRDVNVQAPCVIRVKNPRRVMALMAATWFGDPSKEMLVIAVTGSDGKTSTTFILRAMLESMGFVTGIIGTILREWPGYHEKADMTTPGPMRVQSMLMTMRDAGVTAVVMEASSHALDQERLAGLNIDVAILTNITRDHLDYHHTKEAYRQAKQRLFSNVLAESKKAKKACVLNHDGPEFEHFSNTCQSEVISYGFSNEAMIHPTVFETGLDGSTARLSTPAGPVDIHTKLVGRHNMYNIMGALGTAIALDRDLRLSAKGIGKLTLIPGRLQRINTGMNGPACFVDYAHTPAALQNMISVLKPLTEGKLIVVFGAGGDRDKGKRPLMGKAACEADSIVLTSDNPRTEDPMDILRQIEEGILSVADHPEYIIEEDRKTAIFKALSAATGKDTVLIAGKGHEDYQIRGTKKRYFYDVETIMEWIKDAN